jgi:hypothetical protein
VAEPSDKIDTDDRRSVQPDEIGWIELLLEITDRSMQEERICADVQPHIIAFRTNEIDFSRRNPDYLVSMRYPKFMRPSAVSSHPGHRCRF